MTDQATAGRHQVAARDPELRRLAACAGAGIRNALPDADDRRAELATARIENHIRKVVAGAPPLTVAQRDRLSALLLRPGAGTQVAS